MSSINAKELAISVKAKSRSDILASSKMQILLKSLLIFGVFRFHFWGLIDAKDHFAYRAPDSTKTTSLRITLE